MALRKVLPDSLVLLNGLEATSPGTQERPVRCTFADVQSLDRPAHIRDEERRGERCDLRGMLQLSNTVQ